MHSRPRTPVEVGDPFTFPAEVLVNGGAERYCGAPFGTETMSRPISAPSLILKYAERLPPPRSHRSPSPQLCATETVRKGEGSGRDTDISAAAAGTTTKRSDDSGQHDVDITSGPTNDAVFAARLMQTNTFRESEGSGRDQDVDTRSNIAVPCSSF